MGVQRRALVVPGPDDSGTPRTMDRTAMGVASHDLRDQGLNVDQFSNVPDGLVVAFDDLVLVTGANGFIGSRVVETLLRRGFRNIRCLVRSATNRAEPLQSIIMKYP